MNLPPHIIESNLSEISTQSIGMCEIPNLLLKEFNVTFSLPPKEVEIPFEGVMLNHSLTSEESENIYSRRLSLSLLEIGILGECINLANEWEESIEEFLKKNTVEGLAPETFEQEDLKPKILSGYTSIRSKITISMIKESKYLNDYSFKCKYPGVRAFLGLLIKYPRFVIFTNEKNKYYS